MCPNGPQIATQNDYNLFHMQQVCDAKKRKGWIKTPWYSLRVRMCLICISLPQHYTRKRFSCSVGLVCRHFCKTFPGRVFIAREETFACSIRLPMLSINTLEIYAAAIVTVVSVPVPY